jgi:hypothetical protein
MPRECKYFKAQATSAIQNRTASSENVFRLIWNRKSPPNLAKSAPIHQKSYIRSLTIYMNSSSWNAYRRLTMSGCSISCKIRRSRIILCAKSALTQSILRIYFNAKLSLGLFSGFFNSTTRTYLQKISIWLAWRDSIRGQETDFSIRPLSDDSKEFEICKANLERAVLIGSYLAFWIPHDPFLSVQLFFVTWEEAFTNDSKSAPWMDGWMDVNGNRPRLFAGDLWEVGPILWVIRKSFFLPGP